MSGFHPIDRCLACGGARLTQYLDLGTQPLANSYIEARRAEPMFPLAVNVCLDCHHSQLGVAVDPDLLYKNYLYTSGTTKTLSVYFDWFVETVEALTPGRRLRVLDIASNDGTLLAKFLRRGHEVLGIDPAENLRATAEAMGVASIVDYWGPRAAAALAAEGRSFDVVIAMNVLGHVSAPLPFLEGIGSVLADGGRAFIQTSQCEMLKNFEFDTIYHEHHSFFTAKSFQTLSGRAGLTILSADKVPVHGKSYLWCLGRSGEVDGSQAALLAQEDGWGYYHTDIYEEFGRRAHESVHFVRETLAAARQQGLPCVGFGAAAKGNTFLNFGEIDLDFIIDDNPLKVGLLTPGRQIPIRPAADLEAIPDCAILILAWNFFDEIAAKIRARRPDRNDAFITYFPQPRVIRPRQGDAS